MDNTVYTNVEELGFHYLFENETKVYLLNADCGSTLHGRTIAKLYLGDETIIEVSIQKEKNPLLLVFCREDNLFVIRELCFRANYYDVELTLKEIGIKFEVKKDIISSDFARTPLRAEKELIVGSCGYSLFCKYQMVWDKWYYFETQSLKAFIEKADFELFSFEWRSTDPVKTKAKGFAMKMICGKKVTLNNLRKLLVVDENELDTQMQEICELQTSEFVLNTYHEGVFYKDSIGGVRISDKLIGFPDFFITKLFTAGVEGKSREIINKYFCG